MNKGLVRANGDYVVFLNTGDRFPAADTLEKVALAAEVGDGEERPAVVYGDTDIVDEKGVFLYHRRLQPPESLTWQSFRDGMLVCHQAFYARLDIARKTPFDTRYRYSADVDWCIKIMREGRTQRSFIKKCARCGCSLYGRRADHKASLGITSRAFSSYVQALWFVLNPCKTRLVCSKKIRKKVILSKSQRSLYKSNPQNKMKTKIIYTLLTFLFIGISTSVSAQTNAVLKLSSACKETEYDRKKEAADRALCYRTVRRLRYRYNKLQEENIWRKD